MHSSTCPYPGIKVTILFDSWKTNTWLGYLFTLLALFLLCTSTKYQYMEDQRHIFKSLSSAKTALTAETPLFVKSSRVSFVRFTTTVLLGVNSTIEYLLM
ncbi:hypothetical protein QYF36_016792 [Acer negundo]|nr:hypothetical protein QYF36_016792 [Acer negundo]